jgi:hypothetical protein
MKPIVIVASILPADPRQLGEPRSAITAGSSRMRNSTMHTMLVVQ